MSTLLQDMNTSVVEVSNIHACKGLFASLHSKITIVHKLFGT